MPIFFLTVATIGVLFTLNAYRPIKHPLLLGPSFFAAWLTAELPVHHLVWQVVSTALFVRAGALDAWPGWFGLALTVVSWVGLVGLVVRAVGAEKIVQQAADLALGPATGPIRRYRRSQVIAPFPIRSRAVTRRVVNYRRVSGRDLRMDIWQPRVAPSGRPERSPVLLYVHGGAFVLGFRDRQGLPMMHHLAAAGWVCVSPEYRLSPGATFPDHLVDVKAAIAWVRDHADELGADPSCVVAVGGSAGGHLVSLAALTPNDPEFQPGFESADTSVQACVPIYGVFDFTNRFGLRDRDFVRLLERYVMKASFEEAPDAYHRASPISMVRADAPPFFVIHGRNDTLVPVGEARAFVDALRATSREPVVYAELPGAQHAFDIFPSIRTSRVVLAIERFAEWAYAHSRPEVAAPPAHDADAGRPESAPVPAP